MDEGLGLQPETLSQDTIDKIIVKAMGRSFTANETAKNTAIILLSGMIRRDESSRYHSSDVACSLLTCVTACDLSLKRKLHCQNDPASYAYLDELEDLDERAESDEQDAESKQFWVWEINVDYKREIR